MKKLLPFLKKYRKECFLAPFFKLLEAVFELFVPLVVASIIDEGLAAGDKAFITRRVLLMILLGLVGFGVAVMAQFFSAKAATGFAAAVRSRVFAHAQSLSFSEIDRLGVPTLINRLTGDVNQLQTGVNLFLRLFLRSPFIVFGAMIMAFTLDAAAARIFLLVIILLFAVVFAILLTCTPLYKKVQGGLDGVLGAETRRALAEDGYEIPAWYPDVYPDGFERTLKKGMKGMDVRAVQEKLIEKGYLTGRADHIYGNKTRNAVKKFQEDNNLRVTGICNPQTLFLLMD